MLYRIQMQFTISQQPSTAFPTRTKTLFFRSFNSYEASDSWADLTNKAKVTLPKNIKVANQYRAPEALGGTNINLGGFDTGIPLYLKGDVVTIQAGYRYFDRNKNDVIGPTNTDGTLATIFQGFISRVTAKKPVVLELEDNMWKLKQLPVVNKTYLPTDTLESILSDILKGTPFTVNTLTSTTFGSFRTQNETAAEVLARLRKDYHFNSYFKGNELRCGATVYVEQDAITDGQKVFKFQHDILDDHSLEYRRQDDLNLSAIAYSINTTGQTNTTKSGKAKTRRQRLEVLVTFENGKFVNTPITTGNSGYTPTSAGERRTFYFDNITDTTTLGNLAEAQLSKYFYTGLRGKFKTFGIPLVRMGDNIDILDPKLPDKNGRYKVKEVKYSGGEHGLRQEISLDYLITRLDAKGNVIN
jgi:hypothetical protein